MRKLPRDLLKNKIDILEDGKTNQGEGKEAKYDIEWAPTTSTIFKFLFSVRLSASWWSLISDCDEVYNYWEPLHLLLFGNGFQTWEYSPIYAIRSWLYICLYALPSPLFLPLFLHSKIALFFFLRFFIGFVTLISELFLYRTICSRFGNSFGRSFILFSLFSTAMFNSSCAFLPSSFSMVFNSFSMAFYLQEKFFLSILFVAISSLIGWPFAALLGLPLVIEAFLIKPKQFAIKFIIYSIISGFTIVGCLFLIDSKFFGQPVIAPLNIIIYNIFSSNGPNLYGWNFNGWNQFRPIIFIYLAATFWFNTFLLQPHKEERFMHPIYPHICLLSSLSIECIYRCIPPQIRRLPIFFAISFFSIFILVSLSRTISLHRNYSGAIEIYKEFNEKIANGHFQMNITTNNPIRICVGKEWHRFPSSFFLPEFNINGNFVKSELFFVRSEFRGLLPGKFAKGNEIMKITKQIPMDQNDQNREEPSHYIDGIEFCNFLVDFEGPKPTKLEPEYSKMLQFGSIIQRQMLISAQSHPLFRAFFIPFTPNGYLKFGTVHMLQRI